MNRPSAHELWLAAAFAGLAGIGGWLHSVALALVGMAGLLCALLLWVWQKTCLDGVSYQRRLSHDRATFGEEITLDVEIVNDKLLPLTWLQVVDRLPLDLTMRGAGAVRRSDLWAELTTVLPMLPYQRVRHHLTVVCDRRGEHRFGPAELTSGDPVGYRRRSRRVPETLPLLVYPKVFTLDPPGIASRVLLGSHRAHALLGDPSRVMGVREYRPGDPLRHVDWRATARATTVLVREHEPTASLRVAVFADFLVPRSGKRDVDTDLGELTVAVAASLVADLAGRGVAVGLYSSGTVGGREIARPPSTAPSVLPDALELLARVTPYGRLSFADVLIGEGGHLSRATSFVVLASSFPEQTLVALSALARRGPVTTIWVASEAGQPPPAGMAGTRLVTWYTADWRQRETLELAA